MNYYYESEDDKTIWWNTMDTIHTIADYRANDPAPVRVWYDRHLNVVRVGNGARAPLWVCRFKTLPTQEEISAVVNLVKAKYL